MEKLRTFLVKNKDFFTMEKLRTFLVKNTDFFTLFSKNYGLFYNENLRTFLQGKNYKRTGIFFTGIITK